MEVEIGLEELVVVLREKKRPLRDEKSGLTVALERVVKLQHAIQEYKVDIQVYENLSEEAKDRLYLETLKRTVNISGGKKDPESLRKEAICDALDSLVEKEGSRQTSMSVANVCET